MGILGIERETQENLGRVIKAAAEESSYWKALTVAATGAFVALGFSYLLYNFLAGAIGVSLMAVATVMVLFMLVFLLQVVLINSRWILFIGVLIQSVLLWSISVWQSWSLGLSGLGIGTLLMVVAVYLGRRNLEESLRIRFFSVGRVVMRRLAWSLSVLIAMIYVIVASSGNTTAVSQRMFNDFLSMGAGWIYDAYPGFSFERTFKENAQLVAETQVRRDPALISLPDDQRRLLVTRTVSKYEELMADFFGMPLQAGEKLSESLFQALAFRINQLLGVYGIGVYIVLAALVALVLRGVFTLIYWPVILVGWLVYKLILATEFAHIELESRGKEVMVMK